MPILRDVRGEGLWGWFRDARFARSSTTVGASLPPQPPESLSPPSKRPSASEVAEGVEEGRRGLRGERLGRDGAEQGQGPAHLLHVAIAAVARRQVLLDPTPG